MFKTMVIGTRSQSAPGQEVPRSPRWPAVATAVVFVGYAVGKAFYAAEGKLGFPGGPKVGASEQVHYAREFMGVETAQWSATVTGLLAAVLVLATVTRVGRRIPRRLMLTMLAVAFLAFGAGAGVLVLDGFLGLGVGWRWWHGLLGVTMIGLLAMTFRGYVVATRSQPDSLAPVGVVRDRTRSS